MDDIDPADLSAFISIYIANSQRYVAHIISAIRIFLKFLHSDGHLQKENIIATLPFKIVFPTSDLRTPTVVLPASKPVSWITVPAGNDYVEIYVFITFDNGTLFAVENRASFMQAKLKDQELLQLFYQTGVLTKERLDNLAQERQRLKESLKAMIANEQQAPAAPRAMAGVVEESGTRVMFDMAMY
jgi:hypothetical protein